MPGVLCPVLVSPGQERCGELHRVWHRPQTYLKDSSMPPLRKSWTVAWRRDGSGTISHTWKEGAKRAESGSFQWCPVTGLEPKGAKLNSGGFLWTSGNTLWGWQSTWTSWSGLECCEVSIFGDVQKLSGQALSNLLLVMALLDQMTSRGPFQPQKFCDYHFNGRVKQITLFASFTGYTMGKVGFGYPS